MRVISGLARGMNLLLPRKASLRPTTDRVRESFFSILADSVVDARVMDLFAGSGSVGIEALSRGAAHCVFVDSKHECVACIQRNVEKAHFEDQASVLLLDAYRIYGYQPLVLESFDLIYADPPYQDSREPGPGSKLLRLMRGIARNRLVSPDGLLVIEHDTRADLPDQSPGLTLSDVRRYGETALSFYAVNPETTPTEETRTEDA
jgi:16S rRNA (guanine966-N2)-methyltransferase